MVVAPVRRRGAQYIEARDRAARAPFGVRNVTIIGEDEYPSQSGRAELNYAIRIAVIPREKDAARTLQIGFAKIWILRKFQISAKFFLSDF